MSARLLVLLIVSLLLGLAASASPFLYDHWRAEPEPAAPTGGSPSSVMWPS